MTEELIKTALLGTEKYQSQAQGVLQEFNEQIFQSEPDREAAFYKQAYSNLLYEEAGRLPVEITSTIKPCLDEEAQVIYPKNRQLLQTILASKDEVLLHYFLGKCQEHHQVVSPELIPLLLDKAKSNKAFSPNILAVCGVTGRWLCELNKAWKSLLDRDTSVADWDTGALGHRKQYLLQLRQSKPKEVLTLLEKDFPQESANNRLEFLELLRVNLSLEDEAFLVSLQKDRSKKVRELAQELLQELPGSKVNQLYVEYLGEMLVIKEERKLLKKKRTLEVQKELTPSQELFDSGIDQISSRKKVKDYEYWLCQLLALVKPEELAAKLELDIEELLTLLLEHPLQKLIAPYLVTTTIRHQVQSWALRLIELPNIRNIELIKLLSIQDAQAHYAKFVEQDLSILLYHLVEHEYTLMDKKLASNVLFTLKAKPYQLQQPDYQQLALVLPKEILPTLIELSEEEPRDYQRKYFINQLMEVRRVMEIKHQFHWNETK